MCGVLAGAFSAGRTPGAHLLAALFFWTNGMLLVWVLALGAQPDPEARLYICCRAEFTPEAQEAGFVEDAGRWLGRRRDLKG